MNQKWDSTLIQKNIEEFLIKINLFSSESSRTLSDISAWIILGGLVIITAVLANTIAKRYILKAVCFAVQKTKTTWDDILLQKKVFEKLSHLAPAFILNLSAPLFGAFSTIIHRGSIAYMTIVILFVIDASLDAIDEIYQTFKASQNRPIKGYLQIVKIFAYIIGIIFAIAGLLDKSPWGLISGLGAMTAIILLVFKDTILGFVRL